MTGAQHFTCREVERINYDRRKKSALVDTPDPQRFIKNAAKFNDLMMMYRCAIREVQTKLEVLDDEFQ